MGEHLLADCVALEHALTYNLPRRAAQCTTVISKDIGAHIDGLTKLGPQVSPETMRVLWPSICKAAAVDVPMLGDFTPGHALWPFIAQAVRCGILAETVKSGPSRCDNDLPGSGPLDMEDMYWLTAELREL